MIVFNGISSDDIGVIVERFPHVNRPARKFENVSVPGRNGDLHFAQNAWENVSQEYEIFFKSPRGALSQKARTVAEWIYSADSYARLEDSYDPDIYRMAVVETETDIENAMNKFGRATVTFNCKPQRWLKRGEYALPLFEEYGSVFNPTRFDALPLITVYGDGAGVLNVGGYIVNISNIDGYVILDSETQNAYKHALNKNNTISAPEFPKLGKGETEIAWIGGIESVEIVPRWWTI